MSAKQDEAIIRKDLLERKYILLKKLGNGSQASVYMVESTFNQKKYAVKTTKYGISYNEKGEKEDAYFFEEGYWPPFLEIRLGMISTSPYISKCTDFFMGKKYIYAVYELETTDLLNALAKGCKMSFSEKVEHIFKIGCGLEYLHKNGFAHCDVKPDNILVSPHRVVLSDLGITALIEEDQDNHSCESYYYRAPEQINSSSREYDLKDYRSVFGRKKSTLRIGESWSYGMLCLDILYGVPFIVNKMQYHPLATSYHKTTEKFIAFINMMSILISSTKTQNKYKMLADEIEKMLGKLPDNEKMLLEKICEYVLVLDPSSRKHIHFFLEDRIFQEHHFFFEKENMRLDPFISPDPINPFDHSETHLHQLRKTIVIMNMICKYYSFYPVILMNAIDYFLQSIPYEKMHGIQDPMVLGVASIYLMAMLYNYPVEISPTQMTIQNLSTLTNIPFEKIFDAVIQLLIWANGNFPFESLYFYLNTEEEIIFGLEMQLSLTDYFSYKNRREVAEYIKKKKFPTKTKKAIRVFEYQPL